jgi:hypothetical protein
MAKEVTKANLEKFAKEELNGISETVAAGFMKAEDAKGRVRELFYLSANFDLGLQEEARKIERDLKSRLEK